MNNNNKKESLRGGMGAMHQNSNSMGDFGALGGVKEVGGDFSAATNMKGEYQAGIGGGSSRGQGHSSTTLNLALKSNPSHSVNPSVSQKHNVGKELFGTGARAGATSFTGTYQPYSKNQLMSSGTKRYAKHAPGTLRSPHANDSSGKNSNSIDAAARPHQKSKQGLQRISGSGPTQMGMSMVASNPNNYGSNFSGSESQNSGNNKATHSQNAALNKRGSLTYRNKNNRNAQHHSHQSHYQQNFTNATAASRDAARQNLGNRGNRGAVSSRDRALGAETNNQQPPGTTLEQPGFNNSQGGAPSASGKQNQYQYNHMPIANSSSYRMTTSDPNSSPSTNLQAFRQAASGGGTNMVLNQHNRFSHANSSSHMGNLKSSSHSGGFLNNGSSLGKLRLSPRNQTPGSNSFAFGQSHRNRKNQLLTQKRSHKDKMEIEGAEEEPRRMTSASINEILLNLMKFEKKRESTANSDEIEVSLNELGKAVDDQKILDCPSDLCNQRTIKVDAERTRINEIRSVWENSEDLEDNQIIITTIENLLTFYTKNSNTTYKQGYNELLAPFLWLSLKYNAEMTKPDLRNQNPLSLSYHALRLFIRTFMPTLFLDDDFICLQSCFCQLRLLLKYHDPEICYVLSHAGVTPELYATSWFFTFFANKCETLDVVCELWSQVIQEQDNKFIFPFSIALIVYNRDKLMFSHKSDLPAQMAGLSIASIEQLTEIMHLAQEIKNSTPISFFESREMDILFGENSQQYFRKMTREQKVQMHLRLEQMQCLPLSIVEFCQNIYPDAVTCGNPKCFKFVQIQKGEMVLPTLLKANSDETGRGGPRGPGKAFSSTGLTGRYQGVLLPAGVSRTQLQNRKVSQPNHVSQQFSPTKHQYRDRDRGPTNLYSPQLLKRTDPDYLDPSSFNQIHFQQNGAKSPFKTLVKQQPIEADASVVPMETETNVKDDDSDNQPLQKMTNSFQVLQQELDRQKGALKADDGREQEENKNGGVIGQALSISSSSKFEDGPSFVKLCEDCKNNRVDAERSNAVRLIILDCRVPMLQKEAMLPKTGKFEINNNCDKKNLQQQVRQLISQCTEYDHICLVGLSHQDVPKDYNQAYEFGFGQSPMSKVGQSNDGSYDIREYHERVLQCIIEIFYKERMKYISFLPGGFEECHQFIEHQNYQIMQMRAQSNKYREAQENEASIQFLHFLEPHDSSNCYHCYQASLPQSPSSSSILQSTATMDSSRAAQPQNYPGGSQSQTLDAQEEPQEANIGTDSSLAGAASSHESQRYRGPGELNQRQLVSQNSDQSKYEQRRYNMNTHSAAQYEEMNDKSEQVFDIFSGFRHWWQDNITNNQKLNQGLINFRLNELDSPDPTLQLENEQVFFRDNTGQQVPLQNVTQQTRNNIKTKKLQQTSQPPQKDAIFSQSQRNQTGATFSLLHSLQPTEQTSDPAGGSATNNMTTSHYEGPSQQSQNQFDGNWNANQQNRFSSLQLDNQGHKPQIESNQSSTKNINQNLTRFTQEQRRANQGYQQTAQANRAIGNRTTTTSKSSIPGLVREPLNKSPSRPQRQGFEGCLDENAEAAKDMLAYQIERQQIGKYQNQDDTEMDQENQNIDIDSKLNNAVNHGLRDMNNSDNDSIVDPTQHHHSSESQGSKSKRQPQPANFLSDQGKANEEAKDEPAYKDQDGDAHVNQELVEANIEESKSSQPTPRESMRQQPQDQRSQNQESSIMRSEQPEEKQATSTRADGTTPGTGGNPTKTSSNQASQQFQLEERSYYLCNGIQKQQSYFHYQSQVKKMIEVDALATPNDIVIYHVKRLASSHLQQVIQQQQMIQWQQKHQEENKGQVQKSEVFGHDNQNTNVTSIIITQYTTICLCQPFSFIQSRFFMHDLIKITSRKSSAKIITFYFRIPQFGEYNQNYFQKLEHQDNPLAQENTILDTYNQNPIIPYQFAYKRKKYQEVKMGFEFKNEEEARDCIERVSILYKRLKGSK